MFGPRLARKMGIRRLLILTGAGRHVPGQCGRCRGSSRR
jgi:hypothetical protein